MASVSDIYIFFCKLFHVVTNHFRKYLVPRIETSNWSIVCLIAKSSVFGNNTVYPCVSQSGISSDCSSHCLKHLNIALSTSKLIPPKMLYSVDPWSRLVLSFIDCLVQLLFGDCEFLHIHNFLSYFLCICVYPFLLQPFVLFSLHLCSSIFVVGFCYCLPRLLLKFFNFFHFRYLFFQMLCSLCLSIEHSLVFLKYFVVTYSCYVSLIFIRFIFMLQYLNLSSTFTFTHMSSFFLLSFESTYFFSFCRVCFSFLVNFLLVFLLKISFDVQARICLKSLICFLSFCILLFGPSWFLFYFIFSFLFNSFLSSIV